MNKEEPSAKPPDAGDINKEVDEALKIRDKIKLIDEVQKHPPKPDEMKTDIPDGIYAIDLNTLLAAQLSDCPATVIPMLIDHGVRTAVDIKETYKPEKRLLEFHYWWVIFLVLGLGITLFAAKYIFNII